MKGLHLRRGNACIERVNQNSSELSLLAKGEGTEVMLHKIEANKVFGVSPSEHPETLEFFFVLKGHMSWYNNNHSICICPGDYFYTNGLENIAYFKTAEPVELLYVSSRPIFSFTSKEIEELKLIVNKVENKSPYTHDHGKRVQEYSLGMAERMSFSPERLEVLLYASLFHDIGKVQVPDEILNKPGKLTSEEMEYIRRHPIDSEKMVKGTFLKNIGDIVVQHHERLDGSGYPYGLTRNQICKEAQIIAVADSFDAMTSDRPYRPAMLVSDALAELETMAGDKYDVEVVAKLHDYLKDSGRI